jgi:pyruvate-formate lyase-activating enzyme
LTFPGVPSRLDKGLFLYDILTCFVVFAPARNILAGGWMCAARTNEVTHVPNPDLESIARTLHEMPFPTRFAVELCADCNLKCTMCHHPQMRRPKGVMPFPLWQKCADEIAAVSPETECWFSFCGEPLLEPELLFRMLVYGKSVGLRSLNVNTNGMLLTPALAEPFLDSGVDLVVFGIDGFSRETFEAIRVEAKRDEVYANVEHLLALRRARGRGPEIQVQFIEMSENRHEIDAFRRYWLSRGATLKIRNMLSWGGKFDTPLGVPDEDRIPCPWAITMMHVFWDGRVPRCPGDTEGEEGVGNAWHEPLVVLWKKLGVYREKHLTRHFGELPERCQMCKDWMTGAAERIRPAGVPSRDSGGTE